MKRLRDYRVKSAAPQSERSDRLAALSENRSKLSCGSAVGSLSWFVLSPAGKNEQTENFPDFLHAPDVRTGRAAQPKSDLTGAALKDCEVLPLKALHQLEREAVVLQRLGKSEAILAAEVQSAALLLVLFFELQRRKE